MPRVVQVTNSTGNLNLNVRSSGGVESVVTVEEENENDVNRNYNQKESGLSDSSTTLRFNINYDLYNVTYSPEEDEVYCLKCRIGGQEVRFKKDARVWLHKSNELKRKLEELEQTEFQEKSSTKTTKGNEAVSPVSPTTESGDKSTDESRKLARTEKYFQNIRQGYGTYRHSKDLDSDISSLADSEADLTYSEESSPSVSLSFTGGKARTNRQIPGHQTEPFQKPDSVASDTSITSEERIISSGIAEFLETFSDDLINASDNNNQTKARGYAIARQVAPAVVLEKESLEESLLDRAVNKYSTDCVAAHTRLRSRKRQVLILDNISKHFPEMYFFFIVVPDILQDTCTCSNGNILRGARPGHLHSRSTCSLP